MTGISAPKIFFADIKIYATFTAQIAYRISSPIVPKTLPGTYRQAIKFNKQTSCIYLLD